MGDPLCEPQGLNSVFDTDTEHAGRHRPGQQRAGGSRRIMRMLSMACRPSECMFKAEKKAGFVLAIEFMLPDSEYSPAEFLQFSIHQLVA